LNGSECRPASNDAKLILVYPEPNSKYYIEHTDHIKFIPKTTKRIPATRKNSLYIADKDGKNKFPVTVDKIVENHDAQLVKEPVIPLFIDDIPSKVLSEIKETNITEDVISRSNMFSERTHIEALEERPLKLAEDITLNKPQDLQVFESLKPEVESKMLITKEEPQFKENLPEIQNENQGSVNEPQKEYIEYDSKISAVLLDLYNDTAQNTEPQKLTTFIEQTIGTMMAVQVEKDATAIPSILAADVTASESLEKAVEQTTQSKEASTTAAEITSSTTAAVQTDMKIMDVVGNDEMMTTTENDVDVMSTTVDFDLETTPIPNTVLSL
jgi:hypothetical protein